VNDVTKKNEPRILTTSEEKLLSALKDSMTVKDAAGRIGLREKTAYNMLLRLRKKYGKARHFVNFIDAQKRRSDLMRMVLTSRLDKSHEEDLA